MLQGTSPKAICKFFVFISCQSGHFLLAFLPSSSRSQPQVSSFLAPIRTEDWTFSSVPVKSIDPVATETSISNCFTRQNQQIHPVVGVVGLFKE